MAILSLVQECSTALDLANSKDHWPVVELLVIAGAKLDTPEEAAAETVDDQVKSSVRQTACSISIKKAL